MGEKLNCNFGDETFYYVGFFYTCHVTSLDNPYNNLTIDGYLGDPKEDVKAIYMNYKNTKYIPTNLGSVFNLTALRMDYIKLVEIKAKDFHGMLDLQFLSLRSNKLSSLPLDVFATLTKLRSIRLSGNQIEELPNGIFENNLEMERIELDSNKIKYLGTDIFTVLKKLNFVYLRSNNCVDKQYDGSEAINQLKNDIKMICKNTNEVPATTATTTTQIQ